MNFFAPRVPCYDQIRIGPAPGSEAYALDIAAAANAWNSALGSTRAPGIPSFLTGTGYDLQVAVSGGGPWCGIGSYDVTPWVITLANTCPNGGNHSDVRTTLTHELSHALGLVDNAEELGQPGVSDGCTTNLNLDGTINALVCQHDIEMVYAAYGMRHGQGLPIDFWFQPIVTGLNVTPSSLTLQPNEQAAVSGWSRFHLVDRQPNHCLDFGWWRRAGTGDRRGCRLHSASRRPLRAAGWSAIRRNFRRNGY